MGRWWQDREAFITLYSFVMVARKAAQQSSLQLWQRMSSSVLLRSPGWHHNTLLDGELVLDVVEEAHGPSLPEALKSYAASPGGSAKVDLPRSLRCGSAFLCLQGKTALRYLVYDAMHICGEETVFFFLRLFRKVPQTVLLVPHTSCCRT